MNCFIYIRTPCTAGNIQTMGVQLGRRERVIIFDIHWLGLDLKLIIRVVNAGFFQALMLPYCMLFTFIEIHVSCILECMELDDLYWFKQKWLPPSYQPIWTIYIPPESPLVIDFRNAKFDLNF